MDAVELTFVEEAWPMSERRAWVLYIGDATAFHAPFCPALEALGLDVVIGTSLADALDVAGRRSPSAVVCDTDYQDGLGLELARALRAHTELRALPLACISSDAERRVEALTAGADLALHTEGGAEAAAAQIAALIRLAGRMEHGREFRMPPPHAISGDTSVTPLTTVLTALSQERRSGVVEVISDASTSHLEIVDGQAVSAAVSGKRVEPLDALRTMLAWPNARFAFTALPLHGAPPGALQLWALCAEALRLQDEEAHARKSSPSDPGLTATPEVLAKIA